MMALGFTGTRRGMTPAQAAAFRAFVRRTQPDVFRHGDCIGADAEAHDIVREECPRCAIVTHPASLPPALRAFKQADATEPPAPPLERNRSIVDATGALAAAPGEAAEVLRSGTWAAIRYARRRGRPVALLLPGAP